MAVVERNFARPIGGDQKLREDAELMLEVSQGSAAAKRILVSRVWNRVYSMAQHMCPVRDEVWDLAQEGMLEILRSAPSYKGQGCLEAWANVICARTLMWRLRRLRFWWRTSFSYEEEVTELPSPPRSDPGEDQLHCARRVNRLRSILSQLSAKQRMAVVLKVVLGHTIDEVAEIMRKHPDAVRYLLKQARKKISRMALRDPLLRELVAGSEP